MIDTIVLRLHKIKKYTQLIHNLDTQDRKGYKSQLASVNRDELHDIIKQGIKQPREHLRILQFNVTNEFIVKSEVKKHANSSGHYELTYFINYTNDYVEFNFSIPKYLYGHNIMMFVDHFGDRGFTYHFGVDLLHNINMSFDKLMKFIRRFCRFEFLACPVDFRDLEVNRIDLCFNQVFPSKFHAKNYLEYQKRIKKKFARDEDGLVFENDDESVYNRTTGIMYKNDRYSAKIYHKGTEYAKHDAKAHAKYNNRKGAVYFNIPEIQAVADRILRYEVTFRNQQLNYLHKKHRFRRKCPIYQEMFRLYQEVLRKEQRNDHISKRIGSLPEAEKEAYAKTHKYEVISSTERKVKKEVSKLINKRTFFVLETNPEENQYNRRTVGYECRKALFSRGLMDVCFNQLFEFVNQYQLKTLEPEDRVRKLIQEHNASKRRPLPEAEMMRFYQHLVKVGSFKETARLLEMSRPTYFRYRQRFKKIGISENHLVPISPDGLHEAPLDLRAYHDIMTFNSAFKRRAGLPFELE